MVGKIYVGGMKRGFGYAKALNENITTLPIISRGKKPWCELSPFYLGPVKDGDLEADNVENFWQFSKVYEKVEKQNKTEWKYPEEIHFKNDKITKQWFKWRDAGFRNSFAVRRPNGKNIPLFAYYKGERLDYIESRKKIYVPIYQKLARKTDSYKKILKMLQENQDVLLIDVDGPDTEKYPNGIKYTPKVWKKMLNDESRPCGHGFVCANALYEDLQESDS